MKSHIILAAGTGFLGRALSAYLQERDYRVTILTRHPRGPHEIAWDARTPGPWTTALEGAAALINLTGKSVNCRYTPAARREIVSSRVDSVRALQQALAQCAQPPPVWIQATSLAIYGDSGDRWCDETAPPGTGFPVETCLTWEQAFAAVPTTTAPTPSTPSTTTLRKVALRIGIALGPQGKGGALQTLRTLVKAGLGGTVGTGRQYISWIHLADLNAMFLRALQDPAISGTYNATSPHPVTNAEFMAALRHALHRPWSPPVPAWAAHLGAWLMRTQPELALTGRRGTPARFLAAGFPFRHPELAPALAHLFPS